MSWHYHASIWCQDSSATWCSNLASGPSTLSIDIDGVLTWCLSRCCCCSTRPSSHFLGYFVLLDELFLTSEVLFSISSDSFFALVRLCSLWQFYWFWSPSIPIQLFTVNCMIRYNFAIEFRRQNLDLRQWKSNYLMSCFFFESNFSSSCLSATIGISSALLIYFHVRALLLSSITQRWRFSSKFGPSTDHSLTGCLAKLHSGLTISRVTAGDLNPPPPQYFGPYYFFFQLMPRCGGFLPFCFLHLVIFALQ